MRDEVFSFTRKRNRSVCRSQQKEFKPVRNMVIREVVQMMEQQQDENDEYDKSQYAAPELKTSSENTSSDAEHSTPPRQEHRTPPPDSIAACMVRMLHHMGNIFRDNVGSTGYRGLQLDKSAARNCRRGNCTWSSRGRSRGSCKLSEACVLVSVAISVRLGIMCCSKG